MRYAPALSEAPSGKKRMTMKNTLWAFREGLRELFFPSQANCMGCGNRLGADVGFLCANCNQSLAPIYRKPVAACPRCGTPLHAGARCKICEGWPPLWPSMARYAYFYEPPIDGLIRRLKYDGVSRLAPFLGAELCKLIESSGFQRPDYLVPVPMHRARLLERGFNQAALLAEMVARETGIKLLPSALLRVRNTRQQARLGGKTRRENLQNAFRATAAVRGKRILLIDDVLTTGETLIRCAQALREAGAWDVQAATLAGPHPQNPR